jgi:hypothetical protein
MSRANFGLVCFIALAGILIIFPDLALAQVGGIGGGDLENRISGLTNKIMTIILPAVSVLGLVYAAILAGTGDQSAKPRMVLIVIASIVGFLAPMIIKWLQSASGVGGF